MLVTGMIPGMIGASIPAAPASSTKRKYISLSKNRLVIKNETPASIFWARKRRSWAMSGDCGCISGKHAAPMANG
jgi:hypothetical protein